MQLQYFSKVETFNFNSDLMLFLYPGVEALSLKSNGTVLLTL